MHKVSKESSVFDAPWAESQEWCNFVLLRPHWLPEGIVLTQCQMRSESPTVRASHRAEFGDGSRSFSIKQFLYDWAPPAYDHPSLWRNPKISSLKDTPAPTCHLIENNYLWMGLDYRRKPAASINVFRTQVELTVLAGDFDKEEIVQILSSMKAVDVSVGEGILRSSFAELTHTHRHQSKIVSVPTGYLKYLRDESAKSYCYPAQDVEGALLGERVKEVTIEGYSLDSVFLFGESRDSIYEVEYYFESTVEPGSYIRVLVTPVTSLHGIPYPPVVSDQECNFTEQTLKHGNPLYHAWSKNNDNGCHSIVFMKDDLVFNCAIKPAPWTTIRWARDLCDTISD